MTRLLLPFAIAVGSALCGQSAPCFALNDANNLITGNTTAVTGTPNVFAYRVALPPSGQGYRSMAIYTGNSTFPAGFMKLEEWYDDPVTNMPMARHVGGTLRIDPTLGTGWQGTNFDLDTTGAFFPGGDVWIVWTEPGYSSEPDEPGGVTVPTAQLVGSTWTMLPQPRALKLRVFCQWLEQTNVVVPACGSPSNRGCACFGYDGYWGTLFTNHLPTVGNAAFALEGTGFPSGALTLLAVDFTDTTNLLLGFPQPSCQNYPGNPELLVGSTGTGDIFANWATIGAAGHTTFVAPIPPAPGLAGLVVRAQLAVYDARFAAALPFSLSNGLRITIY